MTQYQTGFRFSCLVGFVMLTACSTPSRDLPPVTIPEAPAPAVPRTEPEPAEPTASVQAIPEQPQAKEQTQPIKPVAVPFRSKPAVVALIDKAQAASTAGNLASAQSDLQRAQRISPRDPNVYLKLATIHYQMQDFAQAEQLAKKGVAVSGSDLQLRQRLWQLIADIRLANGDDRGAVTAAQEAAKY
ncbi:hypothetical protein Q7C_2147 [Methylophaga frappieri]|uniref:Uncharacterized protein n=1 Tax=Methylophaga frappieri (strain ATCC BAA-2434 / DSM 25690 / JAM7) TaxID=754477 RepID=I1YK40_METFJ|nr:tetratricopeptide repeat protein [Methylophaga frappieri]AFJ03283.1 hypothetical protein Q7C_2147 [Methylophaga frappieri]